MNGRFLRHATAARTVARRREHDVLRLEVGVRIAAAVHVAERHTHLGEDEACAAADAVSYTHLTLPTICSV
eukprot:1998829-Prymnesium_polylepis.1